ncbi:hypothetical protein V5H78_03355 [Helicobacter pylori]
MIRINLRSVLYQYPYFKEVPTIEQKRAVISAYRACFKSAS